MKIRLHLNIFIFIIIFILTRQIEIYGIIMIFSILHELGHIITGLILGFKPDTLEIMPFGLSIQFCSDAKNYNKKIKNGTLLNLKKIVIATSGPLVNIIFTIFFMFYPISFFNIQQEILVYSNILIAIFNLITIYPLDGGRILNNILYIIKNRKQAYRYTNIVSNITISILTGISSIVILYCKNYAILIILGYLWFLVIKENKIYEKKMKIYEKIVADINAQSCIK